MAVRKTKYLEKNMKDSPDKELIENELGKAPSFKFSFNDKLSIAIVVFCLAFFVIGTIFNKIEQKKAIDIAVKIASISIPEISGSQVTPFNIHAEKMTLEKASKHLNSNRQNTLSEESLDMQVWLVTMDGIWLPANVPDVVQKPYQHLSIIIDAKTGQEIYRNMQP